MCFGLEGSDVSVEGSIVCALLFNLRTYEIEFRSMDELSWVLFGWDGMVVWVGIG
jgi:hypothetical protein